jgi:hypothetical protein
MNFIEQLRRHIGFLERSCASYDAGNTEEALRIAVSLRVLFHDTKNSTSLLTHLNLKLSALVLSTFEPGYKENKEAGTFVISMPVFLNINSSGVRTPPLSKARRQEFISASEWWDEIIAYSPPHHKVSRKDVILGASNQDGGAHVDSTPNEKLASMIKGNITITKVVQGKRIEQRVNNDHFPWLRQFGHEVLNSPDISQR